MTIREIVTQQNPDALLYPERYDAALVGMTLGFGTKSDTKPVAVYDHTRLLEILGRGVREGRRARRRGTRGRGAV